LIFRAEKARKPKERDVAKTLTGTLALTLGILAAVFALTAVIGLCPLYCPFKLSTLKKKE
jgi:hypothetical protein